MIWLLQNSFLGFVAFNRSKNSDVFVVSANIFPSVLSESFFAWEGK